VVFPDKAKPSVRVGRKATGLLAGRRSQGFPGYGIKRNVHAAEPDRIGTPRKPFVKPKERRETL